MILELVEFNSPKGWSRATGGRRRPRSVIPKWRANQELVRKHFLLGLDGKTGAGVYIWPSIEAARTAHDDEWREVGDQAHRRLPTIRYFDLFLLVDNEKGDGPTRDWSPRRPRARDWRERRASSDARSRAASSAGLG